MPDLRTAIVFATALRCSWTLQDIAQVAGVSDTHGLSTYLGLLVGQRILLKQADGSYRAGPKAESWRRTRPKTRPGGKSASYRLQQAARDRLRQRDWQAGRTNPTHSTAHASPGTDLPVLTSQLSTAPSIPQQGDATVLNNSSVSMDEAAAAIGISSATVRREIERGHLKAYRAGVQIRIDESEVLAYKARRALGLVKVRT